MKRPAFLSGFLMMLVGLGLTIAVMFVLPFHKDAAAPCFYLVRMTAVLGFASALAGVMLQFSSAGLAAGIQLMNMLLGIVITLAAAFVIGPCTNQALSRSALESMLYHKAREFRKNERKVLLSEVPYVLR